jgi:hypothetical protein
MSNRSRGQRRKADRALEAEREAKRQAKLAALKAEVSGKKEPEEL